VADDANKNARHYRLLTRESSKIFIRLALHVLLIGTPAEPPIWQKRTCSSRTDWQTWCQNEYASLALAWFPSLSPRSRQAILLSSTPPQHKYRASWRARFEEHTKAPPTADNERFSIRQRSGMRLEWRSVLPVSAKRCWKVFPAIGDPDSWRHVISPEESPLTGADFSSQAFPTS